MRLALLGLTFKAGTDDLRDSPALAVAALLRQAGAELVGYDPALCRPAARRGRDRSRRHRWSTTRYVAAKGVEAVVVLTEWPEFRDAGLGARWPGSCRSRWSSTPATCSTPPPCAAPA